MGPSGILRMTGAQENNPQTEFENYIFKISGNVLKLKSSDPTQQITCHLYVNKQCMYFLRVIYGSYLEVHHEMNAVIITVTIFQLICVPF